MHARAIYNVLIQGRKVQKGGSNDSNSKPPANHTLALCRVTRPNVRTFVASPWKGCLTRWLKSRSPFYSPSPPFYLVLLLPLLGLPKCSDEKEDTQMFHQIRLPTCTPGSIL